MALGIDNLNGNNIITLCSVGLVDIFNQPSILWDNLFPLSQKYFDDFPANIDMNNMHVNNNHSVCQANVPKVNECQLYNSCSQIISHGWLISTLIPLALRTLTIIVTSMQFDMLSLQFKNHLLYFSVPMRKTLYLSKASRSHDLDELKSRLSKYDSFYDGLTQQYAFEYILLLMGILSKGSWHCFSSNYAFTTTAYDGPLSYYLFSFTLEQRLVLCVCGVISPSPQPNSILYITIINSASLQELVMQWLEERWKKIMFSMLRHTWHILYLIINVNHLSYVDDLLIRKLMFSTSRFEFHARFPYI